MIPDHTHNRKKRRKNPHKPRHDLKGFIKFTAIAVVIMVGFEYVAFGGGERPYITKIKHDYYARKQAEYIATQQALEDALPPEVTFSAEELSRLEADNTVEPSLFSEKYLNITKLDVKEYPSHEVKKRPSVTPLTVSPVLTMSEVQKKSVYKNITKPKIAIVIDDVGMNIKQSHAAIDLPIKATLAMLPYAKQVRNMAHKAKQRGHELIIHTPMEAMNGNNASLGTMALRSDMDHDNADGGVV